MLPKPAIEESSSPNWNIFISSITSSAVLQTSNYIDITRRPGFIQTIETLHMRFSRHHLAHSSSFLTLMELICPIDANTNQHRVDEWLEFTVCFHALLDDDEIGYLNDRIMTALSVYFMEHPDDLLAQPHGEFKVDRAELRKWIEKVAWFRAVCAVVLFWLPNDYTAIATAMRSSMAAERGG